MLLNLLAALSLASIGAVAGIASNSQSVDGAELDKSSLIERKDAFTYVDGKILNYFDVANPYLNNDDINCVLDVTLESGEAFSYDEQEYWFNSTNGWYLDYDSDSVSATLIVNTSLPDYVLLFNDMVMQIDEVVHSSTVLADYYCYRYLISTPNWQPESSFYHLALVDDVDAYLGTKQIVPAIASGLTSVQHYATSLVSGFDALALDNGALTNSMAFAFTLLGIGTAVGICKLTFNWITGRHGM